MTLAAVFLLSLSALMFEVLLTRVFSIAQWNHLSFMVISIALFGLAASGTVLNILDTRQQGCGKKLAAIVPTTTIIILYSISAITAFVVLNRIPLDYFRLPLEPVQTLYLLSAYLLLSLPFFFTGLVVSVAYAYFPEKTGLIYFASMAGSACGAILPVPLLPFCGEGRLVIFAALIPLILVPFGKPASLEKQPPPSRAFRRKRFALQISALGIFLVAGLIASSNGSTIAVRPSPYKGLSQMLQFPDTRITATTSGIRGRIDTVQSPYVRFAPGLSLKFTDTLPGQGIMFKDGDDPFVLYSLRHPADRRFTGFTLPYAGYLLAPNPENLLLILHGAGGLGIPCALASGAKEIIIVQEHPQIARVLQQHYGIPVINQSPRMFLARSDKRFDIIHVENWGATLPGSAALTQEYLFTVEAFTQYLKHLKTDGILIIARKLLLPPSDSIRMWASAYESLRSIGIERPEHHIAMLRNWNTYTLMVSARPLPDTKMLAEFARNRNFDWIYLEGLARRSANQFNKFEAPFHFLEINRLAQAYRSGTENDYFKAYLLDISPQTDNRPFPGRFLKWTKLKTLYQSTGSRFYALFMSGEIVVAVVFVEALAVSALLLVLPLAAIPKESQKPNFIHILYFLAVGVGYMFVELFFIKKYIYIFGDPVVSFTVVLTVILVSSGFGGYWSRNIGPCGLRNALLALIVVLTLIFFGFDLLVHRIIGLSTVFRYLTAILLLIPAGFLAGLPFPLGMRYLFKSPGERAYAWAANGCASVLTSIACAQIALSLGIHTIIACAAAAYLLAFISAKTY
ncbi:MAG: hypothetical protein ABIK98_10120 [Pseudomonadota bacterium]